MADTESANEWTIIYHASPIKGRSEFLKLLFEDAGIPYSVSNDNIYGPEGWCDMFRGGPDQVAALDNAPFPTVFPPMIWHRPPAGSSSGGGEVLINQTGACMAYVGSQLGYGPASEAERARMDCIMTNAMDLITAGRASFHPTDNSAGYSTQKEEGDRVSKLWSETKLPVWLQHFEKVAKRANEQPLAGGPNVTAADFAVFHVIDAAEAQFNTPLYNMAWDSASIPHLKAFKQAFASRPKLAAYIASKRRMPWAGDSMM